MWNKIGSWLDYPENWCSFVFRLIAYPLFFVVIIFTILFGLFLPVIMTFMLKESTPIFAVVICYGLSFAASGTGWWLLHRILEDKTQWYPNLLAKLPKCPKIKWNK